MVAAALELGAKLAAAALEAKLAAAGGSKVASLQSRVQSLHAAPEQLSDEELYSLEDIIADSCEEDAGDGDGGDDRVAKMVALSEKMTQGGAFARQLRRKFVS